MAKVQGTLAGAAPLVGEGGLPALNLEKHRIPVRYEERPLKSIRLDPANPRLQHLLAGRTGKAATPTELREILLQLDGVGSLQKSIRENGGLQEPIYVLEDGLVVEGNCRAAIYLKLADSKNAAANWSKIPAYVIPMSAGPRAIAVLQGICHVAGKTRWDAFEQAAHVYHMHHTHKMSDADIQNALGMTAREIQVAVHAYSMMADLVIPTLRNRGASPSESVHKYSYVAEYHKRKEFAASRGKKENDKLFVDIITADPPKLSKGQQVRQLHAVLQHPGAKRVLLAKKGNLEEALKELDDPVVSSKAFKQVEKTTRALKGLRQDDIDQLQTSAKAQALLVRLHEAVLDAARFARVALTGRKRA